MLTNRFAFLSLSPFGDLSVSFFPGKLPRFTRFYYTFDAFALPPPIISNFAFFLNLICVL